MACLSSQAFALTHQQGLCIQGKMSALENCQAQLYQSRLDISGKRTGKLSFEEMQLKFARNCQFELMNFQTSCRKDPLFKAYNVNSDDMLSTACPKRYNELLKTCSRNDIGSVKLEDYAKMHDYCPKLAYETDKKLKNDYGDECPPKRPGFDTSAYEEKPKEEPKEESKAFHGKTVSGEKCELRRVRTANDNGWKIWNGFDVFRLDPKKYLGHIHGNDEKEYFEKSKFAVCKPTEEVEEVVVKDEYKSCEWVDYQEWSGQLGCKTEKSKVCIGKIACTAEDGTVKYHNVACAGVDGECPSAAQCASDESLQSTEKSFISDKYSTETKVKAE